MFTGIIEAVGEIVAIQPQGGDVRLRIAADKLDQRDVKIGDSIAVNGVCLTATTLTDDGFWADASRETLERSILGSLKTGARVNLERSLTPTTRMGGHLVSGHVDGVGTVIRFYQDARSWRLAVQAPDHLARYIAEKGSICIDGISLTVNQVQGAQFEVNIVPHTFEETTISGFRVGQQVNLEVDLIARYLERLLLGDQAARTDSHALEDVLRQNGFLE